MKYIVGAGIGGLFGFSVPLMLTVEETPNDLIPRIEDSQPVETMPPIPIDGALILPDNVCGYIDYESEEIKEQAKECLNVEIPAVPAI
jgi:hypothetical protein